MTDQPKGTTFLAVTPSMRLKLATTIENLIALLDEIEGDPDLEETGDLEPSIGWPEGGPSRLAKGMRHDDDCEADLGGTVDYDVHGQMQYELEADDSDREPNGDERDCDLAGATTELEYDYGDYDGPLLIPGGNELVAS